MFVLRDVKSVSQANTVTPASSLPRKNKLKKATQEKRQERKAAKTLSAILLVFILTWTPYNVLAVMKGILGPEQSEVFIEVAFRGMELNIFNFYLYRSYLIWSGISRTFSVTSIPPSTPSVMLCATQLSGELTFAYLLSNGGLHESSQ